MKLFDSLVSYRAPREQCDRGMGQLEALEDRLLLSVSIDKGGWTKVGASKDTRVIYVSSSAGKDSNDGLSPNSPVKTLAKAKGLLRDGKPDWLLLKRGDVWEESLGKWKLSGRSAQEPLLISAYGNGARPLLKTGTDSGIYTSSGDRVSHVAIIGLELYAHHRDPSGKLKSTSGAAGVKWLSGGSNLLIEDTIVRFYSDNIIVQSKQGFSNFKLRRSQVLDAYGVGRHSQGMFISNVNGVTLEENLFDHNGWNEKVKGAQATIYNHNIYVQVDSRNLVVRDNIIARAASHGLQARPGGVVSGNLFVANPLGASFGLVRGGAVNKGMVPNSGVGGQVTNNVFLNGNDIAENLPRGTGLEMANLNGAKITGNLFAHETSKGDISKAIMIDGELAGGMRNTTIENNTIYNWMGGLRVVGEANRFNNVTFTRNLIQNLDSDRPMARFDAAMAGRFKLNNNTWHSPRSQAFRIDKSEMSFNDWTSRSGEKNSRVAQVKLVNPTRDAAAYNATQGKGKSNAAFLQAVRANGVTGAYAAAKVNAWIRAGYQVAMKA